VDEAPKDKFGKQLKSFTEWLKTMKRISPTQMPVSNDTSSENKVQNLAQDSIHDSSVWTEAMAEVWAKQGNTQKAIEVLNKLSLLNPSKKAYFATKIENLKRS
jgi:outer membrane PBP1 activator LpoA protein